MQFRIIWQKAACTPTLHDVDYIALRPTLGPLPRVGTAPYLLSLGPDRRSGRVRITVLASRCLLDDLRKYPIRTVGIVERAVACRSIYRFAG